MRRNKRIREMIYNGLSGIYHMESAVLSSVYQKRLFLQIMWESTGSRYPVRRPENCQVSWHGLESWHLPFRFILIFQDIPIWHWDWPPCSGSGWRKILIIRIYQKVLPNSGGDGIFPSEPGFGNMYIFRWGGIGQAE